jgi:hypothetical protein
MVNVRYERCVELNCQKGYIALVNKEEMIEIYKTKLS